MCPSSVPHASNATSRVVVGAARKSLRRTGARPSTHPTASTCRSRPSPSSALERRPRTAASPRSPVSARVLSRATARELARPLPAAVRAVVPLLRRHDRRLRRRRPDAIAHFHAIAHRPSLVSPHRVDARVGSRVAVVAVARTAPLAAVSARASPAASSSRRSTRAPLAPLARYPPPSPRRAVVPVRAVPTAKHGARVVDERDALWASIDAPRAILARERRRRDSRRTRRAKERARHRSRASNDGARVASREGVPARAARHRSCIHVFLRNSDQYIVYYKTIYYLNILVAACTFPRRGGGGAAQSRDDDDDDMVRARARWTTRERDIILARCARANPARTRDSTRETRKTARGVDRWSQGWMTQRTHGSRVVDACVRHRRARTRARRNRGMCRRRARDSETDDARRFFALDAATQAASLFESSSGYGLFEPRWTWT